MSRSPASCFQDKNMANTIVSTGYLNGEKIRLDVCHPSFDAKKNHSWNINKLIAVLFVVFFVATIFGCVVLSCSAFSTFRKLQNKIDALERRLEQLENSPQVDEYSYDNHGESSPAINSLPSLMSRGRRNAGRERKLSRRATRSGVVAIHMEMVNITQRRKRNPSTENSDLINNWKVSEWVPQQGSNESFRVPDPHTSEIVVKQKGLYFIYSQILFLNLAERNIFSIKINGKEFIRCYKSVDYAVDDSKEKFKTCYTGAVALIRSNENVTVHNLYNHKIHASPSSNFFGLIKLADIP